MRYVGYGTRSQATPQSEPVPGSSQIANSAGGYSWAVDDMTRLQRFLILGTAGGTYYASERKLTKENLDAVERLLKDGRGLDVVDCIVEISKRGRAPSNDPALFALARCCAADNVAVKRAAYTTLPAVARIGTHLLHFMEYEKQFRGRGRLHRRALAAWYNEREAAKLAFQVVKYQSRDGWSQRDVLRLTRPKPASEAHNAIYHWATKGWDGSPEIVPSEDALGIIWAFERAKCTTDPDEIAMLIHQYHLPREAVPTESLTSVKVWNALLEEMHLEAMTRNLATMTRHNVLAPMGEMTTFVSERLRSREELHRDRVHPIKLLAALITYRSGRSVRGTATWTPVPQLIDALDEAFYAAFENVAPSGKRILLALDVSGSMSGGTVAGVPGLTPRIASSALALVTAATEPNYTIMAFSRGFVPLPISPKQRLDDVVHMTDQLPFDGTDCARPMLWAMERKVPVDAFVVYTDSETWAGTIHPTQALARYRKQFDIPAKLIVVGMTSNGFSIADPNDAGMLDIVGMDTATPELISSFVRDEI